MSEAEFALIAPLLPPPKRRGQKPTGPQVILNALFYMIRCGCPWRYLPKDFPPFTTVRNRFYAWRDQRHGAVAGRQSHRQQLRAILDRQQRHGADVL